MALTALALMWTSAQAPLYLFGKFAAPSFLARAEIAFDVGH